MSIFGHVQTAMVSSVSVKFRPVFGHIDSVKLTSLLELSLIGKFFCDYPNNWTICMRLVEFYLSFYCMLAFYVKKTAFKSACESPHSDKTTFSAHISAHISMFKPASLILMSFQFKALTWPDLTVPQEAWQRVFFKKIRPQKLVLAMLLGFGIKPQRQ